MKIKLLLLFLAAALALFSCTKRKPEEIAYAPNAPNSPYPPDSSSNIDHTTTRVSLSWACSDQNGGALYYDVYLDTLNPPVALAVSGLTAASYLTDSLKYNNTYYWKIFAKDDQGVTTASAVWSFTTLPHANQAPTMPQYLTPPDDTLGAYPTLALCWDCTDPDITNPEEPSDTIVYHIYLGTSPNPPLIAYSSPAQYEACCLNYSTLYQWRVVAIDNHGATSAGPIAEFTTRNSPWYLRAPMPVYRVGFASVTLNGKIYVIGGKDEYSLPTGTVQEYDPLLDAWTIKQSMPTPRYHLAAAACSGYIYAIGGKNIGQAQDSINEEYNPSTDTWTQKAPMITPRYGLSAQTIGSNVYAIGGFNGNLPYSSTPLLLEVYNRETNTWAKLWKKLLPVFRPGTYIARGKMNVMSGIINGKIYVAGGFDPWNNVFLDRLEIYDPSRAKWMDGGFLSRSWSNGTGVVTNNYFYLIGGYNGNFMRRVERYDPNTGSWQLRGDMLYSRSGCGGGVVNNDIYIVGGYGNITIPFSEQYRLNEDP
jgi:hypothetical protein